MLYVLLAILVFISAAIWDFAIANYNLAVKDLEGHKAGMWSLLAYVIGAIGFVLAVKITLWLMIPEGLGMYVGTRVAIWQRKKNG